MSGFLTILPAEPADDIPAAPCGARMSMTCGRNFVSRLYSTGARFDEHPGPLSIKCVFRGREAYTVERTRLIVDESAYLLLNHGQTYASEIRAASTVDSLCVWFRPGFVEQALAALAGPDERRLDDPAAVPAAPLSFFERLYPHDQVVSPVLGRIYAAVVGGSATTPWLDEQFYRLAERLVLSHRATCREVDSLPAARAATREELYRRLCRSRDYLEASLADPVTLADVAAVACLSPHHFLRLFKTTFGETPRQYQTRRRMERARDLLLRTDAPVTHICYEVGFESLGSFSWLFKRLHGAPPSQYRMLNAPGRSPGLTAGEALPDTDR